MSTEQKGDSSPSRHFRERSTITAHKYPTKALLKDEQLVGESYEETILRCLDELRALRESDRALEPSKKPPDTGG